VAPNALKDHGAFVFKCTQPKKDVLGLLRLEEGGTKILPNNRNHSPDTVSHPSRSE
jgi:hypothetical protein